jgi:ABC-type polysaccharide/polyol phosphate transport system ATPase subunit
MIYSDMNQEPAIRFDSVSKRFKLNSNQADSVLDTIVGVFSRSRNEKSEQPVLLAMNDVNFEIWPGETVGLVGRNGSGKSTLLKLASGIIRPSDGRVEIRGRLSALLELGAGFHPDLTGKENIALNASILGLSNAEIDDVYDDIMAFSELGDLINMPVKHYSSGMYMRLGFSVAIHVQPEILLIDEILAVGDQSFQDKCINRLHQLRDQGTTIIFVSHNLETVRSLCSRILWISHGKVLADGPAESIADQYEASHVQTLGPPEKTESLPRRWGSGEIEMLNLRLLDSEDRERSRFVIGEQLTVEMNYVARKPVEEPEFGLAIHRVNQTDNDEPFSLIVHPHSGVLDGQGITRCRIDSLPLFPAEYTISATIYDSAGKTAFDHQERILSFQIVAAVGAGRKGLIDIPATWETNVPDPEHEQSTIADSAGDNDFSPSAEPSKKSN